MHFALFRPLLIASITLLSACGGSNATSGSGNIGLPSTQRTFTELETDQTRIDTQSSRLITLPTQLPTTGSVNYTGVINLALGTDTNLAGDMLMKANFTDNEISGRIGNVVDQNNASYTGTAIIDGDITPNNGDQLNASITGNLRSPNDRIFPVTLGLVGAFFGAEYETARGDVRGEVFSPDLPGGSTSASGTFAVER